MPSTPLAVEAGVMTRILRQKREAMISLAALSIVVLTTLLLGKGNATVLLLTNKNESRAFPDMEAVFGTCKCSSSLLLLRLSNMPLNLSRIFVTAIEVGQNSRISFFFHRLVTLAHTKLERVVQLPFGLAPKLCIGSHQL
jgi:hypothetical protein